jgi:hypothetical protein
MAIPNSSSSMSSGSSMGSPKDRFVEFFFEEFRCYTTIMRNDADEGTLDRATTALLSICPDPIKRRELYRAYTKEKTMEDGKVAASSELAGNFMSYMSELLEFTEKSYASVF